MAVAYDAASESHTGTTGNAITDRAYLRVSDTGTTISGNTVTP